MKYLLLKFITNKTGFFFLTYLVCTDFHNIPRPVHVMHDVLLISAKLSSSPFSFFFGVNSHIPRKLFTKVSGTTRLARR